MLHIIKPKKMIIVITSILCLSSCFAQKTSDQNNEQPIITRGAYTKLESVNQLIIGDQKFKIGQTINQDTIDKSNIILKGDFFEINLGELLGFEENNIQIGWNNRNRLIYVSTTNKNTKTINGIGIGSSKKEVIDILGTAYLSTSNRLRYQNIDFELQGMVLYFVNDKVNRIIIFAGI